MASGKSESDQKFLLHVWKGAWGLPSVDHNCLAVLSYCKFSGVPVDVTPTGNPWGSPAGELPSFKHGDVVESNICRIFSHLRKQNWGCDFTLSTKQSADALAFSAMVEEKFIPALLYTFWLDSKTYVDVTRPCYARSMPLPLTIFLPGRKQRAALSRISMTMGGESVGDSEILQKVYGDAKECLNLLSHKLESNPFMFGQQPSSLDAIVFGCLAPMLKAPIPTNQIATHLRQCTNLSNHVDRIMSLFFKQEQTDGERRAAEEVKVTSAAEDVQFPHRRRNLILGAIAAVFSLLTYATLTGLIKVRLLDRDRPREEIGSDVRSTALSDLSAPRFEPVFGEHSEGEGTQH